MKELKYILQLKYFSSKLSVLWKKSPTPTNSYFRFTSSTPLCSSLVFWFCQRAERSDFASLSGQTSLLVIFQLRSPATKIPARSNVCFVFLGPKQGEADSSTAWHLHWVLILSQFFMCSAQAALNGVVGGSEGCWQLFACCRVLERTTLYFLRTVCTWLHGRVSKSFCNFPACIQRAQLRGSGQWWAICGIFREVGRYQWCNATRVHHAEVLSPS